MDPDKLIDGISKEMSAALKDMGKAKSVEERLMYSEMIKNLTKSFGVFVGLMNELAYMEEDDEQGPF